MDKNNKWVIKAGSSLVSGNHEGINSNLSTSLYEWKRRINF